MRFVKTALLSVVSFSLVTLSACAQSSDGNDLGDVTPQERAQILSKYEYLDPENTIPTAALGDALVYFDKHQSLIRNKAYMAVIDYSKNSAAKRFFIVNMKNGTVWNVHVAHGKGSDLNHDGQAERFGNADSSYMTSLGFYLTDETYYGEHGLSLRLDGLSKTNSNARNRAIVVHGADYVHEADVIQGRSWGCPAVDMRIRDQVINVLKDGALIYSFR